jgi:hypothetical protein
MNEYSLFVTSTTNNDESETNTLTTNTNNNNENYDISTVDLQSSISVDFDVSSANETTNIENINSIIDTSNLINALSNVQSYNGHQYYQPNSTTSNTNLNSDNNITHQNFCNAQLNLDSLDQCIQIQAEPFKFATVSYSAQSNLSSWRNTPTYTISASFDEPIQLEGETDLQPIQNQPENNYFCMSNNFNTG